MTTETLKGTIQGYFDRAFTELESKEFQTPLIRDGIGFKAGLAKNSGTFVQFRTFDPLPLSTKADSDSPVTYAEDEEPAAPMELKDDVFQASLRDIVGYLATTPRLLEQDPVDVLKTIKTELVVWARRMMHVVANDRLVVPFDGAVTNLKNEFVKAPQPLKTLYAGGVAGFGSMRRDNYITLADILRAAAVLRNENVPMIDDRPVCVIDSPGIQQLALGDSKFLDAIKRAEDQTQRLFGHGSTTDYAGVHFVCQSDPYRCQLPDAGGALRVRKNVGDVRVCHMLGRNCFGTLDLGEPGSAQRKLLNRQFKVQDITVTGTKITIALRFPFQAMVMKRSHGVNLAYTSAFDETVSKLPDEFAG